MLRAIFRRRMKDAVSGCQIDNQLFTIDFSAVNVERELSKGGYGESGFEVVELVGVEVLSQDQQDESVRRNMTNTLTV